MSRALGVGPWPGSQGRDKALHLGRLSPKGHAGLTDSHTLSFFLPLFRCIQITSYYGLFHCLKSWRLFTVFPVMVSHCILLTFFSSLDGFPGHVEVDSPASSQLLCDFPHVATTLFPQRELKGEQGRLLRSLSWLSESRLLPRSSCLALCRTGFKPVSVAFQL